MTEDPEPALARLASAVDVPEADLVSQADRLEPPRTHSVDEAALPESLRRDAADVYEHLRQRADSSSPRVDDRPERA